MLAPFSFLALTVTPNAFLCRVQHNLFSNEKENPILPFSILVRRRFVAHQTHQRMSDTEQRPRDEFTEQRPRDETQGVTQDGQPEIIFYQPDELLGAPMPSLMQMDLHTGGATFTPTSFVTPPQSPRLQAHLRHPPVNIKHEHARAKAAHVTRPRQQQ